MRLTIMHFVPEENFEVSAIMRVYREVESC